MSNAMRMVTNRIASRLLYFEPETGLALQLGFRLQYLPSKVTAAQAAP